MLTWRLEGSITLNNELSEVECDASEGIMTVVIFTRYKTKML